MEIEIKTNDTPLEVGVEKAGPQGLSAYQVAVKNGFIGTEQEWLDSLVGEKGDKGDKGDTGEQGIQGERGLQGEQGIQGEKGEKGDKGDTGEKGADGVNGTNGRDGYVQYTAGDNITIDENNVISATGGDLSNYYTKTEIDTKVGELFYIQISGLFNLAFNSSKSIASEDLPLFLPIARYLSENLTATPVLFLASKKLYSSVDEKSLYVMSPNQITTISNVRTYHFVASSPNKIVDSNNKLYGLSLTVTYNFDTDTVLSASLSRNTYEFIDVTSNQTITSTKTFNTLPQTSIVPTNDNDMVNKKYVDDQIGNINTILATLTTPGGNS